MENIRFHLFKKIFTEIMKKKTKELNVKVPISWSAISLKKYLELKKDIELYQDNEEAYFSSLLYHLCDVEPKYIRYIDAETLIKIKSDFISFMGKTDFEIQTIIKIDGKEYGFIPNLSKMSYGEYLDITQYDNITIDENWSKIMSILYRPITKKKKYFYEIKPYTGEEDYTIFDNVGMDINFGAMFFFMDLSKTLPPYILNSTLPKVLRQLKNNKTIQKSGKDIHQSIFLLEEKLKSLTK